jgi:hypothetical protein
VGYKGQGWSITETTCVVPFNYWYKAWRKDELNWTRNWIKCLCFEEDIFPNSSNNPLHIFSQQPGFKLFHLLQNTRKYTKEQNYVNRRQIFVQTIFSSVTFLLFLCRFIVRHCQCLDCTWSNAIMSDGKIRTEETLSPNRSTIPVYVWRDWGKLWKPPS